MLVTRKTQLAIAIAAILAGAQSPVAIAQVGSALSVQHDAAQPVVRSARRDTVDSERFTAGPNETFELLLVDGTSVTLAAGTEVTINRYRYDAANRLGELSLAVHRGAVRIIGGVLNNTSAITVSYPGGQASLDNAIATVAVDDSGTDIALLLGKSMTFEAGSATQTLSKPGSVRIAAGGSPELSPGSSSAYERLALAFNPGLGSGVVPVFVTEQLANADTAATSEVEEANSAAKELALVLTPQETVAGIPPSGCSSCGVESGSRFQFDEALSTPGSAGSEGGSTATTWVLTSRQDQSVLDSDPVDPKIDYTAADDGYRNTTNRMFGVRGYSQFIGDGTCAANDVACAPVVHAREGGDYLRLGFAFGTRDFFSDALERGDAALDFVSTLWLSDYAFRQDDGNNTQIDFVTTTQMGGNILAGFTFTAPSTLDVEHDGVVQSLVAGGDYRDNLLSETGTGNYALLQAGMRRTDVARQLNVTYSNPFDIFYDAAAEWGGFDMSDEARNFLCSSNNDCSALEAAFENRNSGGGLAALDELAYATITDLVHPVVNVDGVTISTGTAANVSCSEPGESVSCSRDIVASLIYLLPDHFFLIEGAPASEDDTRRFLYATGAVSGRQNNSTQFSVDRFLLSAGLESYPSGAPVTPGTTPNTRAFFLPDDAFDVGKLGLTLADAGAYVINPAITSTQTPDSRLLHTDFGLSNACPNGQCSTISLTLGTLSYGTNGAQFSGYTIGSTRTDAESNSVAFQSGLLSTALGGGNPALACSNAAVGCSDGVSTSGRAGYLVLENYTPEDQQLTGGAIHSVGAAAADDQRYALLRLATATGSLDTTTLDRAPLSGTATGFIAGLAEGDTQRGGELAIIKNTSAFNMNANAAAATVSGSVSLSVASLSGAAAEQSATLNLGTSGGYQSAFLDNNRYAAMAATAGGAAPTSAFVSGAAAFNTGGDVANPAGVSLPTDWTPPAYMQWGFFFGDVVAADSSNSSPQSWHAHLVPWVRGTVSDTPLPSTGSAQYSGFAIGNVAADGQMYTAFGTYQNNWDFASRRGTGHLDLDSARYAVRTQMNSATSTQFNGALLTPTSQSANANTVPSNTTAVGNLNGTFVSGGSDPHRGVMGSFEIGAHRSSPGAPPVPVTASTPENYVVIGVFGAERQ